MSGGRGEDERIRGADRRRLEHGRVDDAIVRCDPDGGANRQRFPEMP
jgi:hypothetical protein